MTKADVKEISAIIRKLAKRSKHIQVVKESEIFGIRRINVVITKDTKLTKLFYILINSMFPYQDLTDEVKWFYTYNNEDYYHCPEYGIEICVYQP